MLIHGMRYTPEYRTWTHMKVRCYNKNYESFSNYGGRGIKVCDEWLNDFVAFFNHVGKKPSPQHTLDRIDNDGNYEPGNVRWATKSEQQMNRGMLKTNTSGITGIGRHRNKWYVRVTVDGVRKSLGVHNTLEEAKAARTQFGSTL